MDIVLHEAGTRFNYRVAAVIMKQEHLLVHQVVGFDFWFLPGGRIQMGESMEEALHRELQEELEVNITPARLLWMVENFFTRPEGRYHEVCGYFLCEPPQGLPQADTWQQDKFTFYWVPLSELHTISLVPTFLQDAITDLPAHPMHLVLRED